MKQKHDVYNGIYNVGPGVSSMGKGDIYAGQAAHITGYAKTSRAEFLRFAIGGKTIGWMNKRAFTPSQYNDLHENEQTRHYRRCINF